MVMIYDLPLTTYKVNHNFGPKYVVLGGEWHFEET